MQLSQMNLWQRIAPPEETMAIAPLAEEYFWGCGLATERLTEALQRMDDLMSGEA